MAETECDGYTKVQLETIANFINMKGRVSLMYHDEIGKLRDLFDIELRDQFKNSLVWNSDTKQALDIFCTAAVDVVDNVRVEPKPYDPGSLNQLKAIVDDIQKTMFEDLMENVTECACQRVPEICQQYEDREDKIYPEEGKSQ